MANYPQKCSCGKGHYNFGSALYAYYSCGHAYEKPIFEGEKGKFIKFNPFRNTTREQ